MNTTKLNYEMTRQYVLFMSRNVCKESFLFMLCKISKPWQCTKNL